MSSDNHIRALSERLSTVYSRLPGVAVVNVVNGCLIIVMIDRVGTYRASLFWLVALALLSLGRIILYLRYKGDDQKAEHGPYWERVSIFCSIFAGLIWGIGPIVLGGDVPTHPWIWAFVIGGMCAGAASLHAAHLPTALCFTVPACIPLAISLLLRGTIEGSAAVVLVLSFMVIITFTAVLFSREFGRSLELKYALEARAVELDSINNRLSLEMAEHRSTSEALYQAQKMESLGNLTGGFAHDFNNLLTVIIGSLDRIAASAGATEAGDMARSAIVAAESGAGLTSRLLSFARKQTLEPRLVNLHDVLTDFRDLLMPAISGALRVEFIFSAPVAVAHVDPAHFQSALLNLVVNAKDATHGGGLITVSMSIVPAASVEGMEGDAAAGDLIAISVIDGGEGMSPETLEKAFEPFFTTKTGRGGSGLGLPQVYGFARQSGGLVKLSSVRGHGTSATIYLPLSREALPRDAGMSPGTDGKAVESLSVLLVDDNAAVLDILRSGLVDHGWAAATAVDGRAALDMVLGGQPFDIVITDIDMPGDYDGVRLANELREVRPDLPVLLISGAPIPVGKLAADIPFLTKPFRKQALLDKVQAVLTDTAEAA